MSATPDVDIAIVGSGFSGLGMAIRLKQEGNHDFTCSSAATTSAAPGTTTPIRAARATFPRTSTRSPSPPTRAGADLLAPARDPRLPAAHAPTSSASAPTSASAHVEEARLGRGRAAAGIVETDRAAARARVLISALGAADRAEVARHPRPRRASRGELPLGSLGSRLRPARKRVASIGTGASAIQFVPALQPDVEQLHVFQRTAPVGTPAQQPPDQGCERRLYRALPAAQSWCGEGSTPLASCPCSASSRARG